MSLIPILFSPYGNLNPNSYSPVQVGSIYGMTWETGMDDSTSNTAIREKD